MASVFGCRVTGIDLTDAFVAAARELTALCGLADRIEFQTANALAVPFADATFDASACQYVAMNIADKAKLIGECQRVLKPGGRLVWSSVVAGSGEPRYPLPWARDKSVSFLVSPEALRKLFRQFRSPHRRMDRRNGRDPRRTGRRTTSSGSASNEHGRHGRRLPRPHPEFSAATSRKGA